VALGWLLTDPRAGVESSEAPPSLVGGLLGSFPPLFNLCFHGGRLVGFALTLKLIFFSGLVTMMLPSRPTASSSSLDAVQAWKTFSSFSSLLTSGTHERT
jgi:hypothetical protein